MTTVSPSSEVAAKVEAAAAALRVIKRQTRADFLALVEARADRRWIRETVRRDIPGCVIHLGRFDTAPDIDGVRFPRILVEVHRPPTPKPPPGAPSVAIVGLSWMGTAWGCTTAEGGAVPWELYAGDPNGEPGAINGDYPWLMPGASEEAVERGVARLRSEA